MCKRGCHIRFSQELDAPKASCAAILRYSDQLSSLHALSLNNTPLRADEIAAVVSKCPSLCTLRLENTHADDKVAAAIACLAHIDTLNERWCIYITDFGSLAACKTLKSLNLQATSVDDRGLAVIASLPCLEELSLEYCASISDFTPLRVCKSLKVLSVRHTSIDDRGVAAVASLPRLEKLDVSGCNLITDVTPLSSRHSLKVTNNPFSFEKSSRFQIAI